MSSEFENIKHRFDQSFGTRDTDDDMQWLINEVERLQKKLEQVESFFSAMPFSITDFCPDYYDSEQSLENDLDEDE